MYCYIYRVDLENLFFLGGGGWGDSFFMVNELCEFFRFMYVYNVIMKKILLNF